jgi:ASF1 like histone chaperone
MQFSRERDSLQFSWVKFWRQKKKNLHILKMSLVNIVDVRVLDNPATFLEAIRFEIVFEVHKQLQECMLRYATVA